MATVIAPPLGAGFDFSRCQALVLAPLAAERRLVADSLDIMGMGGVRTAQSASAAWDMLDERRDNILFLDWSPQTDAIQFLRILRLPDHPHRLLPVVVMTSFAGIDNALQARDSGANELLLRPWSQDILVSRLRGIIEHPRLFIHGGHFFGPDRRLRRETLAGRERRRHENWAEPDRRKNAGASWGGQERRQGQPGFVPLERRNAPRV